MKKYTLLIEIGCEELPAQQYTKIYSALFDSFVQIVQDATVQITNIEKFITPRRLTFVADIDATIKVASTTKLGPFLDKALNEHKQPNSAGLGFAKSCGVAFDDLKQVDDSGKLRLSYNVTTPAVAVSDKLLDWLQSAYKQMRGVKTMRWSNTDFEFPRPVHWTVIKCDNKYITGTFLGANLIEHSYGHRFMAPQKIKITDARLYENIMQEAYVIASLGARESMVREKINQLLPDNMQADLEPDLLAEVLGLVEWPEPLLCKFDKSYLDLPVELLVEVMRVHQKCFPVVCKNTGAMQPFFVTVSNIKSKNSQSVILGNQKVMSARLADARFFYESDKKVKLSDRVVQLSNITFHASLGSYLDKVFRVENCAVKLAGSLGVDLDLVATVAKLSFADLCTETVNEFPSLQSSVGSELAILEGESEMLAAAIRQSVLPRNRDDAIAKSVIAQIVAIADKIDTLVGFFGLDIIPTGDKDPYGLRRHATGVVRTIVEGGLTVNLESLVKAASDNYPDHPDVKQVVLNFLFDRFKVWWAEHQGNNKIFAAVVSDSSQDLLDEYNKMSALRDFIDTDVCVDLIQANKRVVNILKKNKIDNFAINQDLITHSTEKALWEKILQIDSNSQNLDQNYKGILESKLSISSVLSDFFASCLVLDDNLQIRQNRLALLNKVRQILKVPFDFSVF